MNDNTRAGGAQAAGTQTSDARAGDAQSAAKKRMRASARQTLRTAMILAVALVMAIVVYSVLVDFMDTAMNGVFVDWVTMQFLNLNNLNELGISAEMALDVVGVRYFFFRLGIFVAALLVAAAGVAWVLGMRRARQQARAEAADLLRAYLANDAVPDAASSFGSGWEELALVASEARAAQESQRRALEDEASRKNDLVTYLAHDLKTPLTSVIGYLSLLDELPDMPAEQRCRYVGVTLEKAERLERLINEFFDITRYELTGIELERAPFDLSFLLVQMAEEFYPALQAHGNTLQVTAGGTQRTAEEPGDALTITADADRLARVFGNLIKNAIAYSAEGTSIEVVAELMEGERVRVTVADDGITIPSHKLRTIFDKFYRLDESRATGTGGAGLGLAIAREIVELHGGTICASSEEGHTVFTVELPVG